MKRIMPLTIVFCLSLSACDSSRPELSPTEAKKVDRIYRSQFKSEQERLEFEAWNEEQRAVNENSPTGTLSLCSMDRTWDT